jgi:hypothetical protein
VGWHCPWPACLIGTSSHPNYPGWEIRTWIRLSPTSSSRQQASACLRGETRSYCYRRDSPWLWLLWRHCLCRLAQMQFNPWHLFEQHCASPWIICIRAVQSLPIPFCDEEQHPLVRLSHPRHIRGLFLLREELSSLSFSGHCGYDFRLPQRKWQSTRIATAKL